MIAESRVSTNSKLGYRIGLTVAALVVSFFAIVLGPWLFLKIVNTQMQDYKDNRTAYTTKWVSMGMPPSGVTNSIEALREMIKKACIPTYNVACLNAYIAIAICVTVNLLFLKYEIIAVGIIAATIIYNDYALLVSIYKTWTFKYLLVMGLCLTAVYYIMRKNIRPEEWLIIFLSIHSPIRSAVSVFGDSGKNHIDSYMKPILTCPDIDSALAEAVIKVTRAAGVSDDWVFIDKTSEINAYSSRGFYYRYIAINRGLIDALSHNEVIAVVHHEAGHIIHNDIVMARVYFLVSALIILSLLMLVYRGSKRYVSSATALFLTYCISGMLKLGIDNGFYNAIISQMFERNADLNAFKAGYAKESINFDILCSKIQEGRMFEFKGLFNCLRTHPCNYDRIMAAEKYIANTN